MVVRVLIIFIISLITMAESEVFDPALYLIPSPPLPYSSFTNYENKQLFNQNIDETAISEAFQDSHTPKDQNRAQRSFWPFHFFNYKTVKMPLTFSISGNYGRYGTEGHAATGIIGASYGRTSLISPVYAAIMADNGRSSLAGTGYSAFNPDYHGIRLYGNDGTQSWSGWGNGKWGHYGSG